MFKLNIHNMFPKIAIVLAVLILSIWFILFVLLRARNKNAIVLLPILSICFYPYIWYFVWAQYSQLHHWMTYREQAGAVMAGLLFLINTVDFNIVHKFFNKRQEGNKW
ncbi:hypothetical protein FACS1894190_05360 [Spirochaetia bacterium]|nr:hypothetical protein FACS1894190_05360 [Spirochaetia bacterium]